MPTSLPLGAHYEQEAERLLIKAGLRSLERNYRCKAGEIDLVMRDGDVLVFVEVRYRQNSKHGSAAATVTSAKQRRIRLTAQHYLQTKHHKEAQTPCRFDVVAFDGATSNWIKAAF